MERTGINTLAQQDLGNIKSKSSMDSLLEKLNDISSGIDTIESLLRKCKNKFYGSYPENIDEDTCQEDIMGLNGDISRRLNIMDDSIKRIIGLSETIGDII